MANDFYNATGVPSTSAALASSTIRTEFQAIGTGLDKLPTLTGAGNRIPHINSGGTAIVTTSGFSFSGTALTVPEIANVTLSNGGALRTTTTSGHTALIQAYDNDTGPGYVTFGTLTAGNTPSFELDNTTLDTAIAKGTWTASGTWTIPAVTLGGTLSWNGQSASGTLANAGTITTADINGGTIDGVTIGGSSRGAGSFTTGDFNSTLTLSGTAANIALGSNFISNGGTDAGLSLDGSNNATISGNLTVSGNTVTSNTVVSAGTTATVFNSVATTVNAFAAATVIAIGAAASALTWTGQSWAFTGANSTNNSTLSVTNTSNAAAASHSIVDISVGGTTSTGDAQIRFTVPGGTSWYIGNDNSDSDKLKIGTGTAVGSSTVLTLDSSGINGVIGATTAAAGTFTTGTFNTSVTTDTIVSAAATATVFNSTATTVNAFGGATTAINVGGAANATTWTAQSYSITGANSTNNTTLTVTNTSNAAAASHSIVDVAVGGTTSTGDPQLRLTIPGGTSWYAGVDNSASDAWILGTGTAVGTNPKLTYSGTVFTVNDNLVVSGTGPHAIGGATNADRQINIAGSFSGSANAFGIYVAPSLSPPVDGQSAAIVVAPTFTEAASGTHVLLAGINFQTPTVNGAGAAVTTAATVYIQGAPTVAGAGSYALVIDSGESRFNGKINIAGTAATLTEGLILRDTTTAAHYATVSNTGGNLRWGVESSTGNSLISPAAADAYAGVVGTNNATALLLFTNGTERMRLSSSGQIIVNDSSNANNASGLTMNQGGNDDEILSFKSSDVAHGMTSITETDTYANFFKQSPGNGGLQYTGLTAATTGIWMSGVHTTDDTTHTASGRGAVQIDGLLKSGTTAGTQGANANILCVSTNGNTRFMVDAEGDLFADGSAPTIYDTYDDVSLVRAFDLARSKEIGGRGVVRSRFDEFVQYNEDHLVEIGILGARRSEGGLINVTRLQQLHNGAIWQLGTKVMDHDEKLAALAAENVSLKAQLQRLENRNA